MVYCECSVACTASPNRPGNLYTYYLHWICSIIDLDFGLKCLSNFHYYLILEQPKITFPWAQGTTTGWTRNEICQSQSPFLLLSSFLFFPFSPQQSPALAGKVLSLMAWHINFRMRTCTSNQVLPKPQQETSRFLGDTSPEIEANKPKLSIFLQEEL